MSEPTHDSQELKPFKGNYGCEICDFTGWVCESHRDRPYKGFSKREDACDCSSGVVCLECRWESDTPESPPRPE